MARDAGSSSGVSDGDGDIMIELGNQKSRRRQTNGPEQEKEEGGTFLW